MFERYALLAMLLTPSWIAGHPPRPAAVLHCSPTCSAAVVWAGGIGMAAYLVGPSVVDAVGDMGTLLSVLLGAGIAAIVGAEILRRRRRRARAAAG